jgi:hypothetical protein
MQEVALDPSWSCQIMVMPRCWQFSNAPVPQHTVIASSVQHQCGIPMTSGTEKGAVEQESAWDATPCDRQVEYVHLAELEPT